MAKNVVVSTSRLLEAMEASTPTEKWIFKMVAGLISRLAHVFVNDSQNTSKIYKGERDEKVRQYFFLYFSLKTSIKMERRNFWAI